MKPYKLELRYVWVWQSICETDLNQKGFAQIQVHPRSNVIYFTLYKSKVEHTARMTIDQMPLIVHMISDFIFKSLILDKGKSAISFL